MTAINFRVNDFNYKRSELITRWLLRNEGIVHLFKALIRFDLNDLGLLAFPVLSKQRKEKITLVYLTLIQSKLILCCIY
jgi:pyoverdine/dityrosine biosynthesis protein Dit1